jgi:hypothetical protein
MCGRVVEHHAQEIDDAAHFSMIEGQLDVTGPPTPLRRYHSSRSWHQTSAQLCAYA